MTTRVPTKAVKAVDELASAEAMRKQLNEGSRLVVEMELRVQRAQEELEVARERLEALGFDMSKPLEEQLEMLAVRAQEAHEDAHELLEALRDRLSA